MQNQALVTALRRDLDRGADLVLLDEKEGRHAAQRLGLRVVGTVGVLLEAKANGAINTIRPHLDGLRQTAGFYLSPSLYQYALTLADEDSDTRQAE